MSESEHSSQGSESGISPGSDSESSSDIMAYSFEPSGTDSGSSSEVPVMVLMIDFQILHIL